MHHLFAFASALINSLAVYFILTPLFSLGTEIPAGSGLHPFDNPQGRFYAAMAASALLVLMYALNYSGVLEWLSTLYLSGRPASKREQARVAPIIERARQTTAVPEIRLMVSESQEVNAFALGKKTVYLTRGLLNAPFSDDELSAIVGHELGHLLHGDSFKQLVPVCTQQITRQLMGKGASLLQFAWGLGLALPGLLKLGAFPFLLLAFAVYAAVTMIVFPLRFLDQRVLTFLLRKIAQRAEFRADEVGAELTSPAAMRSALERLAILGHEPQANFWERQLATHPPLAYRLDKLDAMCAANAA